MNCHTLGIDSVLVLLDSHDAVLFDLVLEHDPFDCCQGHFLICEHFLTLVKDFVFLFGPVRFHLLDDHLVYVLEIVVREVLNRLFVDQVGFHDSGVCHNIQEAHHLVLFDILRFLLFVPVIPIEAESLPVKLWVASLFPVRLALHGLLLLLILLAQHYVVWPLKSIGTEVDSSKCHVKLKWKENSSTKLLLREKLRVLKEVFIDDLIANLLVILHIDALILENSIRYFHIV